MSAVFTRRAQLPNMSSQLRVSKTVHKRCLYSGSICRRPLFSGASYYVVVFDQKDGAFAMPAMSVVGRAMIVRERGKRT